ncbi:GntR family transcriptional regulator [Pseudonocardia ailaonensis]|uniref:GntR family transcriptional regulator n=1 Tax=Pseudonocardia ailaonensis TaxID=367279 RepID=A0ABN2N9N1_9PSEU
MAARDDSRVGLLGHRPRPRRRNMSDEVFDYVRSRIFDGTLKADQRIPQDAVATALGVSRVPVREALIALEQHGLVASEPHRGTYVVPIRAEDIDDHYRMYGMIQGLAAARAVHSITEPVLDRLDELHEQMCTGDDPDLLWDLNYDFHSLINHTGGSSRVRAVLRHLSHNFPRELYALTPGSSPEANAGHARILAALRARDGVAADLANQEHVRAEGENIVVALRRAGILADS